MLRPPYPAGFWSVLAALVMTTAPGMPALAQGSAPLPAVSAAPAVPAAVQQRVYQERTALLALDRRCRLFDAEERLALEAFAAQARGALLRSGSPDASVARWRSQAAGAVASRPCTDPSVVTEAARVRSAHRAWRTMMTASYPGTVRVWTASRAGVDSWRAWQELGAGVRAGFIRTGDTVVFAVESPDTGLAAARLFLRDPARLGPPRAGQRLTPALRVGTVAHGGAARQPAVSRARVAQAPRAGTAILFSAATSAAVAAADPRDSFEIELVGRGGQVQTVVVEVGDIAAAWAFAQIG